MELLQKAPTPKKTLVAIYPLSVSLNLAFYPLTLLISKKIKKKPASFGSRGLSRKEQYSLPPTHNQHDHKAHWKRHKKGLPFSKKGIL